MKTTVINNYILLYNNSIYSIRVLCSHVATNSVLQAESVDTTFAVHQQEEEPLEETYGRQNRRRNFFASL